jgi:hypothetical protein
VIVAAVVVIVVAVAGGGSATSTLDPVARAAETTSSVAGAQIEMTGSVGVTGLSQPLRFDGRGSFDLRNHEGSFDITISGLPQATQALTGSSLAMKELFKSDAIYVGTPLFSGKLPNGASWVKLDLAKFEQAAGLDPSALTSGGVDPSEFLSYLRGAGSGVKLAGHDTIRGIPTTHYSGDLDVRRAIEATPGVKSSDAKAAIAKLLEAIGSTKLPVNVWIDGKGRVRRIAISMKVNASGQSSDVDIDVDFLSFNASAPVTAPPAAQVYDLTGSALSGLSSLGG